MNEIPTILNNLSVPTKAASAKFRAWLHAAYPKWPFVVQFSEALPGEWYRLQKADVDLCYLASEEIIMETVARSPGATLLPVGALMTGARLVIDTLNIKSIAVGRLRQIRAMAGEEKELSRSSYHDFEMSYVDWLKHIWGNPGDTRYL